MGGHNGGKIIVITHTDLDGVVSAAIYINSLRASENSGVDDYINVHFTEPHKLHNLLRSISLEQGNIEKLALMDLGPNSDTFDGIMESLAKISRQGARVEWYDHHKWNEKWVEKLREESEATIFVEPDTCAAGVVFRHVTLPEDKRQCLEHLMHATCAADIWTWDHPMAPLLYRVTNTPRGPKGDAQRRILLEKFLSCKLWEDEWTSRLEEMVSNELKGYSSALKSTRILTSAKGVRVAFLLKEREHPPTSFVASFLMRRKNTDVAVILRKDGALSLRSTKFNVRETAMCLGGGGHPRASGAKVKLPFYYSVLRFILPPIYKRILFNKVVNEVKRCLDQDTAEV